MSCREDAETDAANVSSVSIHNATKAHTQPSARSVSWTRASGADQLSAQVLTAQSTWDKDRPVLLAHPPQTATNHKDPLNIDLPNTNPLVIYPNNTQPSSLLLQQLHENTRRFSLAPVSDTHNHYLHASSLTNEVNNGNAKRPLPLYSTSPTTVTVSENIPARLSPTAALQGFDFDSLVLPPPTTQNHDYDNRLVSLPQTIDSTVSDKSNMNRHARDYYPYHQHNGDTSDITRPSNIYHQQEQNSRYPSNLYSISTVDRSFPSTTHNNDLQNSTLTQYAFDNTNHYNQSNKRRSVSLANNITTTTIDHHSINKQLSGSNMMMMMRENYNCNDENTNTRTNKNNSPLMTQFTSTTSNEPSSFNMNSWCLHQQQSQQMSMSAPASLLTSYPTALTTSSDMYAYSNEHTLLTPTFDSFNFASTSLAPPTSTISSSSAATTTAATTTITTTTTATITATVADNDCIVDPTNILSTLSALCSPPSIYLEQGRPPPTELNSMVGVEYNNNVDRNSYIQHQRYMQQQQQYYPEATTLNTNGNGDQMLPPLYFDMQQNYSINSTHDSTSSPMATWIPSSLIAASHIPASSSTDYHHPHRYHSQQNQDHTSSVPVSTAGPAEPKHWRSERFYHRQQQQQQQYHYQQQAYHFQPSYFPHHTGHNNSAVDLCCTPTNALHDMAVALGVPPTPSVLHDSNVGAPITPLSPAQHSNMSYNSNQYHPRQQYLGFPSSIPIVNSPLFHSLPTKSMTLGNPPGNDQQSQYCNVGFTLPSSSQAYNNDFTGYASTFDNTTRSRYLGTAAPTVYNVAIPGTATPLSQQQQHNKSMGLSTALTIPAFDKNDNNADTNRLASMQALPHQLKQQQWHPPLESPQEPPPEKPVELDVDALREQNLRFDSDLYTPRLVRFSGHAKEGFCDLCPEGRWLQLKNSAFWYHKQFYHGISSVSGQPFFDPLEKRIVHDPSGSETVHGFCHYCRQWITISSSKRRNSVLWYRHAHKCHEYQRPKHCYNGVNPRQQYPVSITYINHPSSNAARQLATKRHLSQLRKLPLPLIPLTSTLYNKKQAINILSTDDDDIDSDDRMTTSTPMSIKSTLLSELMPQAPSLSTTSQKSCDSNVSRVHNNGNSETLPVMYNQSSPHGVFINQTACKRPADIVE